MCCEKNTRVCDKTIPVIYSELETRFGNMTLPDTNSTNVIIIIHDINSGDGSVQMDWPTVRKFPPSFATIRAILESVCFTETYIENGFKWALKKSFGRPIMCINNSVHNGVSLMDSIERLFPR